MYPHCTCLCNKMHIKAKAGRNNLAHSGSWFAIRELRRMHRTIIYKFVASVNCAHPSSCGALWWRMIVAEDCTVCDQNVAKLGVNLQLYDVRLSSLVHSEAVQWGLTAVTLGVADLRPAIGHRDCCRPGVALSLNLQTKSSQSQHHDRHILFGIFGDFVCILNTYVCWHRAQAI